MLLGASYTVWAVMALCIIIAFAYALAEQCFSGKKNEPLKYGAIAVCAAVAMIATIISKHEIYVGAPMIALIIGIIIVNLIPDKSMPKAFKDGASFVGKKYLSLGIICLGATLSFTDIFSATFALPLVLFNILLSFGVSNLVGRKLLHVSANTCTLVGGGTCVCGGTAIATLSPIINAKEEETAYAMTAIFLFDLLACLTYPYMAFRLGFDPVQFGFLAGTAINDTSSVVAAQETFASLMKLENYALPATIKVVRTSMIIVLALVFSLISMKGNAKPAGGGSPSLGSTVWKSFPKFIIFFVATVALNTVLSHAARESVFYVDYFKPFFSNGYKFFVTMALCGVGFKIKFKDLFTHGLRPIILGGCAWACLFLSSFIFARFFVNSMAG